MVRGRRGRHGASPAPRERDVAPNLAEHIAPITQEVAQAPNDVLTKLRGRVERVAVYQEMGHSPVQIGAVETFAGL